MEAKPTPAPGKASIGGLAFALFGIVRLLFLLNTPKDDPYKNGIPGGYEFMKQHPEYFSTGRTQNRSALEAGPTTISTTPAIINTTPTTTRATPTTTSVIDVPPLGIHRDSITDDFKDSRVGFMFEQHKLANGDEQYIGTSTVVRRATIEVIGPRDAPIQATCEVDLLGERTS